MSLKDLILGLRGLILGLRGLSFGPERTDFEPERADLGPERGLGGGGRTDVRTDVRMDVRTDVRTYGGENSPVCECIGHLPLRGRCPKRIMAFFLRR